MGEEYFDVVDENDQVIGRETRRLVHASGLRHRAIHWLVSDGAGRILLQKRSQSKDTHPGRWDSSASGHVDAGEDYDQAARRELMEELGFPVDTVPAPGLCLPPSLETGMEFVRVFSLEAEGPFRFPETEIECIGWFQPEDVDAWVRRRPEDFAPSFVLIWESLRSGAR